MRHHLIFVYGTLKKHHHNHYLVEGSEFLGPAKTLRKYSLYESGIPYVIENDQTSEIHGEVYRVDDLTLERLDQLEGHPDWYERKEVEVLINNDKTILAWLYFFPKKTGTLVKDGRYTKN